jgi:Carboxypeptidase regulatory-like domain
MSRTAVSLASLILLAALPVIAQETASISGQLTDPTGASVPHADVALTNLESQAQRTTATDAFGHYAFLQLPAGVYRIRVEKTGFQTEIRRAISLSVSQAAVIDFRLQVGAISQQIEVDESAPMIGAARDESSGLVGGDEVRDLPLNGRSYDQLMTLDPGIVNYSSQKKDGTPGISNSAVANIFAVSGRRPQENLFLLDGVEYTGSAEINMTPGGTSGELLGVDSVREFNVLADTYGAEYGKRPGAQVLIVDRSGTNELHGSIYEFLRNSDFDARNFFDRAIVPGFARNQFGGSLGGPLVRNRTFLFGDYEGFRQNLHLSDVTLVPDNNARAGILNGQDIGTAPRAAQLLSLWPVQNGPELGGGIAEAFSSPRQTIREDFGTVRLDQVLADADTMGFSYLADDSADDTPTADPLSLDLESLREQVASLRETHIFSPNVVNTATAGFSRASYYYTGESAVNLPGFIAGGQVGAVVIGGSATPNTASSITTAGSNYGSHLFATRNLFSYADRVSMVKGRHQLRAGLWFQRVQSNDELALGQYGQATFSSLQAFLEGTVTTFTAVPSPTPLSWRSWEGAWFVEDQIRLFPRLSLSLGFRDEFTTGWNEAHGRASTFVFGADGALETQPRIASSTFTVNRAKFLPEPRIGLAWDPHGSGRTVVRAGFGLYDDLQDALAYRLDQNAPFNTSIALSGLPLADLPIVPGAIPSSSKVAPAGVQQDLYTPAVIAYTLTVERELTPNTSLSFGYAGSHAYHETISADLNQPLIPGADSIPSGTPLANPALGSTWTWVSEGNSLYNALKVDLRRRLARGLDFRFAYTWSKSLDNGDTLNASAAANAPGLAEDARDLHLDWGPSTFDVRHVIAAYATYDLPFGPAKPWLRDATGFARILAEGWSINGLETWHTGFPFTPQLSFNPSNNGNTTNPVRPSLNPAFTGPIISGSPNEYFNPAAFVVPPNGTYGNLGRDSFSGPGLAELDVSLVKRTRVSERLSLELRGEAFNILNHANFDTPNLIVFTSATAPPSGSAGVITATSTSSRQIQIAAKLVW